VICYVLPSFPCGGCYVGEEEDYYNQKLDGSVNSAVSDVAIIVNEEVIRDRFKTIEQSKSAFSTDELRNRSNIQTI
jgi:hypothetical protein